MFYDGWQGLVRVVVVGVAAYTALILLLRVSGKRTLAKLNAFDFVVTVAIGSTLATMLLSSTVALAEGLVALALMVGLQYVVASASNRSPRVERLVKSEPRLVYHGGYVEGVKARQHGDVMTPPDAAKQCVAPTLRTTCNKAGLASQHSSRTLASAACGL